MARRLLLAHGPNFSLLGSREPEIYGRTTLAEIEAMVTDHAAARGYDVECFQSNSEGALLDFLHQRCPGTAGIVLNGGAFTHYSYALYDCLRLLPAPVVEVHISNLYARGEEFRTRNVTAAAAVGVITGLGVKGYMFATEYLIDRDQ
jgi:3-dehydroquinate dehydratase II